MLAVPRASAGHETGFSASPLHLSFPSCLFCSVTSFRFCCVFFSFPSTSRSGYAVSYSQGLRRYYDYSALWSLLLYFSLLSAPVPIFVCPLSCTSQPSLPSLLSLPKIQPSSLLPLLLPVHRSSLTLACLRPSFLLFFLLCPSFALSLLFPCQLPPFKLRPAFRYLVYTS